MKINRRTNCNEYFTLTKGIKWFPNSQKIILSVNEKQISSAIRQHYREYSFFKKLMSTTRGAIKKIQPNGIKIISIMLSRESDYPIYESSFEQIIIEVKVKCLLGVKFRDGSEMLTIIDDKIVVNCNGGLTESKKNEGAILEVNVVSNRSNFVEVDFAGCQQNPIAWSSDESNIVGFDCSYEQANILTEWDEEWKTSPSFRFHGRD